MEEGAEPRFTPDQSRQALSPGDQDEIALSRLVYPHWIKEGGGAVADPRLQQALKDFCRPLFAVSDRANLPWTVTLVNNPEVNASAGLAGMVIVNAGLLPFMDDPYAFAAVLAHEIGHVDCRHTARGTDMALLAEEARKQGATAMGDRALAQLMPELDGRIADFMTLMKNAYSREDEAEADAHAVELFERRGIDPRLAANGMRAIQRLEQVSGGGAGNEWVTDHPLTPDRIRHMERVAALRSRPAANYVLPGWDVLKAAIPTDPRIRKA
ncbi:MAG: M48 family metallopeptidase [Magnetospirillum sp.]|nr:M48 family metallopeptidase [Magnetospirillum sp.]